MGTTGNPCTRTQPLTLDIGGPVTEDMRSLLFTPANPCGEIRRNDNSVVGPLVRLFSSSFCVGGECPGDRVLVSGHIQAVQRLIGIETIRTRSAIPECEGFSTAPWLKLSLGACGIPGPVFIDSDSFIVMPAGSLSVSVWAPPGWRVMGRDFANPTENVFWWDVILRITSCPLDCCYCPEGVLTEWGSFTGADDAARTLLRPRRASSLQVHASNGAGAPQACQIVWTGDPFGEFGATAFNAAFPSTIPVVSASPTVRTAATAAQLWTWGIK